MSIALNICLFELLSVHFPKNLFRMIVFCVSISDHLSAVSFSYYQSPRIVVCLYRLSHRIAVSLLNICHYLSRNCLLSLSLTCGWSFVSNSDYLSRRFIHLCLTIRFLVSSDYVVCLYLLISFRYFVYQNICYCCGS